VKEIARAQKFYSEVLGWECSSESMQSQTPGIEKLYSFKKDNLHGCMVVVEEGNHVLNVDSSNPGAMPVLPTFSVSNVDEASEKAGKFGGKTHV